MDTLQKREEVVRTWLVWEGYKEVLPLIEGVDNILVGDYNKRIDLLNAYRKQHGQELLPYCS